MNTLIIFLKYPEPGKVKTRLAKDVGAVKAADIYSNMTSTIIQNVLDPQNYNTAIFYDPPEKETEVKNWLGEKELLYFPQEGRSLGDKISNAFREIFSEGSEKTVIIGSDCIDVNAETINNTIELLNYSDIVVGPAEDGGYYLLGASQFNPQIFEDIDWSTDRVLGQTIEKIKENNLKYRLLKTLKDIDTVYDLKDKIKELAELKVNRT